MKKKIITTVTSALVIILLTAGFFLFTRHRGQQNQNKLLTIDVVRALYEIYEGRDLVGKEQGIFIVSPSAEGHIQKARIILEKWKNDGNERRKNIVVRMLQGVDDLLTDSDAYFKKSGILTQENLAILKAKLDEGREKIFLGATATVIEDNEFNSLLMSFSQKKEVSEYIDNIFGGAIKKHKEYSKRVREEDYFLPYEIWAAITIKFALSETKKIDKEDEKRREIQQEMIKAEDRAKIESKQQYPLHPEKQAKFQWVLTEKYETKLALNYALTREQLDELNVEERIKERSEQIEEITKIARDIAKLAPEKAEEVVKERKGRFPSWKMSAETIFDKNNDAVVVVKSYDGFGRQVSMGSGFSIDENGLIVTNLHVIKGSYLDIKFPEDGTYEDVYIAGLSKTLHDLVLLKVDGRELPYVRVDLNKPPDVSVGNKVVVISSPLGLVNSLTGGMVSGIREIEGYSFYQIDAPISPGSSGGPVFNEFGEVIGIATAGYVYGQNLNLCTPINEVANCARFKNYLTLGQFSRLSKGELWSLLKE